MKNIEIYNYILSEKFEDKIKEEKNPEIKNIMKIIKLSVFLSGLTDIKEVHMPLNYWQDLSESREYFIKDCFSIYTGRYSLIEKGATSSRCQVKCRDEEGYRIFNHSTEIKEYVKNFQQNLDRLKSENEIKYDENESWIKIKIKGKTKEERKEKIIKDLLETNKIISSIIYRSMIKEEISEEPIIQRKKIKI